MKIVSINIEGHRHLDRVVKFLEQEQPDLVNIQEVYKVDLPVLEHALQMKAVFTPMVIISIPNQFHNFALGEWGIAQLSKYEIETHQELFYNGKVGQKVPIYVPQEGPNQVFRAVTWIRVRDEGKIYTIANTHFTWTPDGNATELQKNNLNELLNFLEKIPDFVLTGDFNAPRGREIFSLLSTKYQDNIPQDVKTTIDEEFHRAGALELVVDGFFSTPTYQVFGVQVVGGVSDHKAIIGLVEKV